MKKLKNIIPSITLKVKKAKQQFQKNIVTPFLPEYEVVLIMYGLVPGQPVTKNETTYNFVKGAKQEAEMFFRKIIKSNTTYKIIPSEIHLRKRRKIVKKEVFGPVDELLSLQKVNAA